MNSNSTYRLAVIRLAFNATLALLILSLGVLRAWSDPHTNVFVGTTFALTAYVQEDTNGPAWTVSTRKFGNGDIATAIATDLGLALDSASTAPLGFLAQDVVTNPEVHFTLRANGIDTDISSNLVATIPDPPSVSSVRPTAFGRSTNTTELVIFEFSLNTTNVMFDIRGPARLNSSSISVNGKVIDKAPFTSVLTANVSGSGSINGKSAVFNGTVRTLPRKVEVQDSP